MTDPIDQMQARLADPQADHGTPCRACGVSALACQLTWLQSSEQARCCVVCHVRGGEFAHD